MKKMLLLYILSMNICICAQDNAQEEESGVKELDIATSSTNIFKSPSITTVKKTNPKANIQLQSKKTAPTKEKLERKIFVNGRINPIHVIITDNNNKQKSFIIPGGQRRQYIYDIQLKQVVCHEKNEKPTTISQANLHTYAVFIFNTDNRLENFHFTNMKEKEIALNNARRSHNIEKLNETYEKTVYLA